MYLDPNPNQLISISNKSITSSSEPSSYHQPSRTNIELTTHQSDMPKTIPNTAVHSKDILHGHYKDEEEEQEQQEYDDKQVGKNGRNGGGGVQEEIRVLKMENKRLRGLNKQLKRQLEDFSSRLNNSLRKHAQSQKKTKIGQQIVQNMELKNAYKMCDIYKKQIAFLKRKEGQQKQGKLDELENRNFQLGRQKQNLQLEVKDLKKIIKQQEKAFKQLAGPNAIKLIQQNQKLKDSLRRMQVLYSTKQTETEQRESRSKVKRTQQSHTTVIEQAQVQALKSKIIKGNRKISVLMNENQKLKDYTEELRNQLIDKDKDIMQLRERLAHLRNRQQKQEQQKQRKRRVETEPEVNHNKRSVMEKPKQLSKHMNSRHKKIKSLYQQPQTLALQQHKKASLSHVPQKYPKTIQKGQSPPATTPTTKWNHHFVSSKIKQLQIVPHPLGHIKSVHVRYDKGQPPRLSRERYASFCCDENNGEYVRYVRGGFRDGLLRYLVVESSGGRKCSFCDTAAEEECNNFQFSCGDGEYLGAFFGENTSQGVCKLGCYVELKK